MTVSPPTLGVGQPTVVCCGTSEMGGAGVVVVGMVSNFCHLVVAVVAVVVVVVVSGDFAAPATAAAVGSR